MNPLQNNTSELEQQFLELLSMINYHRSRASHAVNEQQLLTAWNVGAYVSNKLKTQQWGSKVVTQFAEFMKVKVPEQKGFSRRNIYNMVMFYEEYSCQSFLSTLQSYLPSSFVQLPTAQILSTDVRTISAPSEIVQLPTAQLDQKIGLMPEILLSTSYTNHIAILNQCKSAEERLFYIIYSNRERLKVKELQR